jgi:Glycosyltransferases, probably involved in cell wall biogenesis
MRLGEYPQAPTPSSDGRTTGVSPATADAPDPSPAVDPDSEAAALQSLGFSKPLIATLAEKARRNGTSLERELLHHPGIEEAAYYGAMARLLRLPFLHTIDSDAIVDAQGLDTQLRRPVMLRLHHPRDAPKMAVVPEAARLGHLAAALVNLPTLHNDLVVTTPSAVRAAVWKAGAARRVRDTIGELFEGRQELSARIVVTGGQGFVAGLLSAVLIAALLVAPALVFPVLHPVLSYLYLTSLLLRFMALIHRRRRQPPSSLPLASGPLPCYTVLVAVYREAAVAEQLVRCLKRIDWPPSLLDIKLVCERDDRETIAALEAQQLPAQFEIVEVPPAVPRTKPKALSYALAGVRGEYIVIYDAEDRPHPAQLREAYQHFCVLPPDVACLQAPLIVTNARSAWISALFALEYAALFRGMLPLLAHHRMPVPLGGTSNHFRTSVLKQVGGWDPFNVTEDADLGLRLFRLGYRSHVLHRQTLEDAPTTLSVWTGQRTRWFKGWMQTWLVMMRRPRRLLREMGLRDCVIFQLLIGGMLLSSLLHPLIFAFLAHGAVAMLQAPATGIPLGVLVLFVVDTVNIFGSYLTFVTLGIKAMTDHEKRQVGIRWVALPLYWLMTSVAAWKAVIELHAKPFFWQKTPHQPSS